MLHFCITVNDTLSQLLNMPQKKYIYYTIYDIIIYIYIYGLILIINNKIILNMIYLYIYLNMIIRADLIGNRFI